MTRLDDATADLVITELQQRNVPVVRLDPGGFPDRLRLNAFLGGQGMSGSVLTDTRTADLTGIRSVYWRRPTPYATGPGQAERWCGDQARYGLGGILAALPGTHYVNHPWRNRDAEYKPVQLATAARCALRILPTLITNQPAEARRFLMEYRPVLYKPLWNSDYTGPDGRPWTVWVDDVDPDTLDAGVARTAHLFQKRLDKTGDVRLTVVGNRSFAIRIDSPGLDWRRTYDQNSYTLIDTPPDVDNAVRVYMETFGLVYGAFDFGIDRAGLWWMYECNPNGQWAWFPGHITARITNALADRLERPGELCER
ncbi:ATP-grasp ribosomal peptide maturase [Streptomyces yunnanensis]|uniref:ATP-grasp ribosomal peptide maturase n=1 Tax=Streptomyces yunnanensis TaxID=156453 RepID=A0ABY8AA25_9ACTN|nr:ATP-grasp ribosomal peptide maturase [Streptomyces yunnanensis]WEB40755.1 ATP-grasp ribosomal peptide maturase [Streptomyces yunnanensis]